MGIKALRSGARGQQQKQQQFRSMVSGQQQSPQLGNSGVTNSMTALQQQQQLLMSQMAAAAQQQQKGDGPAPNQAAFAQQLKQLQMMQLQQQQAQKLQGSNSDRSGAGGVSSQGHSVPVGGTGSLQHSAGDSTGHSRSSTLGQQLDGGDRAQSLISEQSFLDGTFMGGWQSNADLPDRRRIIFSIVKVIERMRPDANKMSQK